MEQRRPHPVDLARAVALALCMGCAAHAETAAPEMHVVAMPLSAVISWYSEQTGQTVVMPDGFSRRVVDVRLTARMDDFTAWLARDFGLDYYRIGTTLTFSPASESVRHMVPLEGVPLDDLIAGVTALDAQAAAPLVPGNQEGTAVLISGPPGYVALVETVLQDLQAEHALRGRIVVNRGGQVTVDDLGTRRTIVAIQPPEPSAQPTEATATAAEN